MEASGASLLIYDDALQLDAVASIAFSAGSTGFPVAVVREEAYCSAALNCVPLPATAPGVPTVPPVPSPLQQQQQQQALTPGTCKTNAAYQYPVLAGRNLFFHRRRFSAMLPMWPPIDNEHECSVRQVIFFVPDDLVDGMGLADKLSVKIEIIPSTTSVNGSTPSDGTPMPVYAWTRLRYGANNFYVIDAQASDPVLGALQKNGDYSAKITITGKRKPGK